MLFIAIRMLFGDPVKLIGLVAGIAFSTLLMAQQGGFFIGLVGRASNGVNAVADAEIWVMDPRTETAESPVALRPIDLYRVRSVAGVDFAAPLIQATVTMRTAEGNSTAALVYGVDDATLTGLPQKFVQGSPDALRAPDSLSIDMLSFKKLWPDLATAPIGQWQLPSLEINDKRAVIVAVTDTLPGFAAPGVLHARASNAVNWSPQTRPSFILVRTGGDPADLAKRITAQTGLRAMPSAEFAAATFGYVVSSTGIAFSFGVVIALGAVVGILVSGLTFTLFVNDNIKQFAVLKAVGVTNLRLVLLVSAQALMAAFLGFSFGLWSASGFFEGVNRPLADLKGFYLPWQIAATVGAATVGIVLFATFISLRRVLRLDPATIFRG